MTAPCPRLRHRPLAPVFASLLIFSTGGCALIDKVQRVGEQPSLSKIQDPTRAPGYQPVTMPTPSPEVAQRDTGSIWQPGARAFFKDQRASRVGDLLTVAIAINDSAKLDNRTQNSRNDSETSAAPAALGLQSLLSTGSTSNLLNTTGTLGTDGRQQVNRSEQVNLTVAAIVTQVLPSGNLVIVGKQEVRVNFEVRDLQITGIIATKDIDATNTIAYNKIAEARIAYGGHGQGTDLQTPRYGTQAMDAVAPF